MSAAWVSIQDALPPNEAVVVRVRRKPDAALPGPKEWDMWSCNVRMHTDEVGWWMLRKPMRGLDGPVPIEAAMILHNL